MAARYWVGGTAAWDSVAGTKWALTSGGVGGQAVPTTADDVFFDAASGANTVTISTGNSGAKSVTATAFTGTLTGTAALTVAGSLSLPTAGTFLHTGDITLTATGVLTSNGKSLNNLTINAPASTVTLGSALTLNPGKRLALVAGTFDPTTSNYAVSANGIDILGAATRAINLRGSTFTLSGTGATWNAESGTGLTITAGTSTISLTGTDVTFAGAGKTYASVTFASTTSSQNHRITGANVFGTLTFTPPAATGITKIFFGANQTATSMFAAGASEIRRLMLASDVYGTARTLTVGTYTTKADVDFASITAAGASAPWSGTRIGNCGGNTSITSAAARTLYWNLAGAQNWSATGWSTTSGGAPAAGNFPLPQDSANFNEAGAAGAITIDAPWNFPDISVNRSTAMSLSSELEMAVYGGFGISGAGCTLSFSAPMRFRKVSAVQDVIINLGSRSVYAIYAEGTIRFLDINSAVTTTSVTTGEGFVVSGTIVARIGGTLTTNHVAVSSDSTLQRNGGSVVLTGVGIVAELSTATIVNQPAITLTNNTTASRTMNLGGGAYGKITIGGNTSVSETALNGTNALTITELASTKTVAHTITFSNTTTTVSAFTVRGAAGNFVVLRRTGASGTFTLAYSGTDVVGSDYLDISDSNATPANTWYAGANSSDSGGNTGWTFTAAPSPTRGRFFALLFGR